MAPLYGASHHRSESREESIRNESLGNRVVSAGAERMTARDSARREPTAAQRTVFFERFDRIRGAAWIITARGRQQRTQRDLISANEKNENGTQRSRLPVSAIGRRMEQSVLIAR